MTHRIFFNFLYIGSVSFGGYMSMVAAIRKRLVEEEKCISEENFSEGLALASILPGPVAVNMACYCGYLLSGLSGVLLALTAVLLPSFLLMIILFYLIQLSGRAPYMDAIVFYTSGIAFSLILTSGLQSFKKQCKSKSSYFVFFVSLIILFLFSGYLSLLFLLLLWAFAGQFLPFEHQDMLRPATAPTGNMPLRLFISAFALIFFGVLGLWFHLPLIFFQFAKIGLTLFGGGYVIVPMLNALLVEELHWITRNDLLTGISLGQLTPGPVLISSAFFGQKVAGLPGALAATAGMFLPAALLMIVCSHYLDYVRSSTFFKKALSLIFPFMSALIIFAAGDIFLKSWNDQPDVLQFCWWAIAFVCVHFLKINTILLIGLAIAAGLLTLAF